ncbi:uncharacterized protein LOC142987094 [Anticarsia gemmatalis]|uniref:uncharacterized protein LOC142987094 n=1 Tax=Anticarsia gemmatalis TaxID=129554 RepID=UPI003F75FA3D
MATSLIAIISLLSFLAVCDAEIQMYVMEGSYANISKFPYSAFLGVQCVLAPGKDPTPWICGSSILNQQLLLTAAHCLEDCIKESPITISVGHERLMQGAIGTAHSFIMHENYNDDDDVMNDIALVRVKKRIQFNSKVSRVALMRKPPYYEAAIIAGWGFDGMGISERLKYARKRVLKKHKCLKILGSLPRGTICADSSHGQVDSGDSGSALVVRGYIQVGVVSYKNAVFSQSVVVYTDTGYHYAWIANAAIKLMCHKQCVEEDDDGYEPTSYLCGSSILNQHILLTAAHCLFSCTPESVVTISVGHVKMMSGAIATAHSFLSHSKFDEVDTINDVAVVRVRGRLRFNRNVSRVALMRKPPYYEKAFVAGWGIDDYDTVSERLKFTEQYVWKAERCIKTFREMPDGTICAYSQRGYADQGDSGGALVVRGYIQVGIVSYKEPKLPHTRPFTAVTVIAYKMATMPVVIIFLCAYLVNLCNGDMEPFIVDGGFAKISNFPYIAFLHVKCVYSHNEEPSTYICGSSILNQHLLLTAAHCVHGCIDGSVITISVGHVTLLEGAIATAHSYLAHQDYDEDVVCNDIALIRVKGALKLNSNVSRVALFQKPPYDGKAFVAGWGIDNFDDISKKLKYTEQYVINRNKCVKLLKRVPKGTICAESNLGYAERGDSGGGLITRGYIQIGLVSYKFPMISKSVVVYTDVGHYYDWIMNAANKLCIK